jgi:sorbitol-specific phosphotransferase system component IIBC
MFSHIIQRRLHDRLPEDSGQWRPVPLEFRHLPPPAGPQQGRKLIGVSAATAAAQVALLSPACWAFFEFFKERDFLGLMALATVIGLLTSLAVGAWIARRYWLDTADTIGVLMRGQVWWCVLVLIPCYGWGALIALGLPCVFGTFFGAGIGAKLGRREE